MPRIWKRGTLLEHVRKSLHPESKAKCHFLQQSELKSQEAATDAGADNNQSCSKLLIKDPDSNKQTPLGFLKIAVLSFHLLIRLILSSHVLVTTLQNNTSLAVTLQMLLIPSRYQMSLLILKASLGTWKAALGRVCLHKLFMLPQLDLVLLHNRHRGVHLPLLCRFF